MELKFRIGKKTDLDSICKLIKSAIVEMESKSIFQWDDIYPTKADFESDIEKNTLFVGEINGEIAVIYVISREFDEEYNNCTWLFGDNFYILHRFCVSPKFQNQGIAKQTLKQIESQIKKMGFSSIRLDVFEKNPYALRLYEKSGYQKRGSADWRKGHFFLMEKKLI